MKKLLPLFISCLLLASCSKPEPGPITYNYTDVFIFMGQSNMAGRGEAEDSIPCTDNGFEYLSVTGRGDKYLIDLKEPFGKYENNEAMTDGNNGDGKKTGSLVSSFVEGYYSVTNVPVIGVSASVGNTSITQWQQGSTYLNESIRRLKSCIDYVTSQGLFKIRHINMLWCQGCNDATAYVTNGLDYFGKFQGMVSELQGLGEKYAIERCYLIPLSIYGSQSTEPVANKLQLANAQVNYCENHPEYAMLATKKMFNVPPSMRVDPHFHQGIYNVVGYDSGIHVGEIIENKERSAYNEFIPGEEISLAERYGINLQYHT